LPGFALGIIPRWTIFQGPWPQLFGFLIFLVAAFAPKAVQKFAEQRMPPPRP